MKTCPYCRMRISPNAIKCPFCQSSFTAEEIAVGKRENRSRTTRYLLWILAGFVALIWWLAQPGNVESLAEWTAKRDFEAEHGKAVE